MLNHNDKVVSEHFTRSGIEVDSLGRVKISDETLLHLISGSAGSQSGSGDQALWNGACSNAHCMLS